MRLTGEGERRGWTEVFGDGEGNLRSEGRYASDLLAPSLSLPFSRSPSLACSLSRSLSLSASAGEYLSLSLVAALLGGEGGGLGLSTWVGLYRSWPLALSCSISGGVCNSVGSLSGALSLSAPPPLSCSSSSSFSFWARLCPSLSEAELPLPPLARYR